jgi:hypothetical protein
MAEKKYAKNIITTTKPNLAVPLFRGKTDLTKVDWSTQFLYLDDEVLKGSNYVECIWLWKPDTGAGAEPHVHDFNEVVGFCGTNFDDPTDLGGEIEFWIDDEQFILTKSCIIFVPKGVKHAPLRILRVDRPIFHFGMGTGSMYTGRKP